jgi:hypothetical protein
MILGISPFLAFFICFITLASSPFVHSPYCLYLSVLLLCINTTRNLYIIWLFTLVTR